MAIYLHGSYLEQLINANLISQQTSKSVTQALKTIVHEL